MPLCVHGPLSFFKDPQKGPLGPIWETLVKTITNTKFKLFGAKHKGINMYMF